MTSARTLVVTIPEMIDGNDLAPLRESSEVVYREVDRITEQDLADLCGGFDYLMLNYDAIKKLEPSFYSRDTVRSLKAISADITGMDWASPKAAQEIGVRLLNTPHYSTESVAETTVAEVFLHSRQRHLAYVDAIEGRPVEARKGINLLGKTAGIVGLGSIGTRVSELLSGVGMQVIAWTRSERPGQARVSLEELFSSAQVICICMKTVREGRDQNVGIINDELLARCRGTIVVNLANADLVDHVAMKERLISGAVSAYTVEHSADAEHNFAGVERVHLPPSNSWLSDESLQTLRHVWVQNVLDAMNGQYPNAVDA